MADQRNRAPVHGGSRWAEAHAYRDAHESMQECSRKREHYQAPRRRSLHAAAVRRSKASCPEGTPFKVYMRGLSELGEGIAKHWLMNKRRRGGV